jgi:hypothetical protein
MNGFGPYVKPFLWFKAYWAAWSLLLAIGAALFWARGSDTGWRARFALARQRLNRRTVGAMGFALALILSLGGFIFYNVHILNDYTLPNERADAAAEYERRYRKYENEPQPQIASAELRVEIYPARQEVDLAGSYTLVNRTARAISSVHVLANENVEVDSLAFDRLASLKTFDTVRHQYRIYDLKQPLEAGDTLRLTFKHAYRRHGFPNGGINTSVAENGAYFDRTWLPRIGYQPQWELDGDQERRERGLPPPREMPGSQDSIARQWRYENHDADQVEVRTVIGTAGDQIAVTPGTLVRGWRDNGRRYFEYRTESPLSFGAPVLSARYAVREDAWNDTTNDAGQSVALKIFHHPTHTFNIDRMIASMKASLDYYTREFGPYQFKELRIVEFPRYANFARAHPHTIAFSEGGAFLTRIKPGDVDRTFFVVAHETAHQWWGGQISPARVRGGALLSETLAQYSSMMVLEKTYGHEHVRRFYGFELDRYLRGRNLFRIPEDPLLDMREQSYLYYQKGGIAMYALKEQIGEAKVNAALRSYLTKWRDAGPPYATARDLYEEIQAVTPDSLRSFVADLFERITLWQVAVHAATAERVDAKTYRVTIDVEGKKLRSDSLGKETEIPMNDLVDIGVFAAGDSLGTPIYLGKHRIGSGVTRVVVNVTRQPGRVGVDPYDLMIQRNRERKVVALTARGDSVAWRAEYRAPSRDSRRLRLRLQF